MNGLQHLGHIHLVHLKALTDTTQKSNRQFAAQVFTKLFQPLQHHQLAHFVLVQQIVCPQRESQSLEQSQDAIAVRRRQVAQVASINAVQRNAHRHGLAVPDAILRDLLQLVRRPVAKIQRSRATHLERIAASRDVVHVQLRAAIDQPLHRCWLKVPQRIRVRLNLVKEFGVADACHLYCLHEPVAFVARLECRQHLGIIDHCERRRECADEILFPERVDAILHAHPRVILRKRRRRDADVPDATVCRRCRKPHHVQKRPTAHAD